MHSNRIQELEKIILKNKDLYYRGHAEISDEAYDRLEDELKKIDPENQGFPSKFAVNAL